MMKDASSLLETYRGVVYPWHCDHMGHMNVMWYVGKFDEATWNLFALMGVTASYLRDRKRAMAAVEQRLQYRQELLAGDTVTVASGVLEVKPKAIVFVHEMRNTQTKEVCATSRLVGVHMDAESRRSHAFPEEVLERARKLICTYDFGER
jgi:acyl-CoA thioester hydrolase